LTGALAALAERDGLDYLDLHPHFRAAGADTLYLHGDEHWNAAGQDLAAARASERIIAMGIP
jgi:hypothetical protein